MSVSGGVREDNEIADFSAAEPSGQRDDPRRGKQSGQQIQLFDGARAVELQEERKGAGEVQERVLFGEAEGGNPGQRDQADEEVRGAGAVQKQGRRLGGKRRELIKFL
jgi:hypothetical protein